MFFVLNGIGLLIQLACVGFVVHVLNEQGKVPANIALLVGIALGTIFRWFSYRKWVWADKPKDAPVGHESLDPVLAPMPSRPTADATNSKAGRPNCPAAVLPNYRRALCPGSTSGSDSSSMKVPSLALSASA